MPTDFDSPKSGVLAAVDIGTGSGAKIGLFTGESPRPFANALVRRSDFGATAADLSGQLVARVRELMRQLEQFPVWPQAIGISSAGLFTPLGTCLHSANIPMLIGHHLPSLVAAACSDVPVALVNDAVAGALGEWSVARRELYYLVVGGGLGGTWFTRAGDARFPSCSLMHDPHPTSEPGTLMSFHATDLAGLCDEEPGWYPALVDVLTREGLSPAHGCWRAEWLISGPGRLRLFRAFCLARQRPDPLARHPDPDEAGRMLSVLVRNGDAEAIASSQAFGRMFGRLLVCLLEIAAGDGAPAGVPVVLSGGVALAADDYIEPLQRELSHRGWTNPVTVSALLVDGINPNLLGARVIAARVASSGVVG